MLKTYHIFISHSWQHVDDLIKLRNLLENRGHFKVSFEEVPPHDPINSANSEYIKRKLREKIIQSDIVIGLAGLYASYSGWMEWELKTASDNDIPVIGVVPRGHTHISKVVFDRSKVDVRWNTESIIDAIRKYSK